MSARSLRIVAAGVLVATALAGCTSSAGGGPSPSAPSTTASSADAVTSQAATPPVSSAPPSTTAPATTVKSTTSSSPKQVTIKAPTTTAPRSTCTAVTVRVIRGSADRGREFAALQFTNDGSTRCTLNGYAKVTLRRGGQRIGTSSQPASQAESTYVLDPGDTAESQLNDYTDCQAPLSDTIHVVVPGSTQTYSRPGELRACTLRVSRLGRPS